VPNCFLCRGRTFLRDVSSGLPDYSVITQRPESYEIRKNLATPISEYLRQLNKKAVFKMEGALCPEVLSRLKGADSVGNRIQLSEQTHLPVLLRQRGRTDQLCFPVFKRMHL
jgi:hypothetical protein